MRRVAGRGDAPRLGGRREGTGVQGFTRGASPEPGNGAETGVYKSVRLDAPPTRWAEAAVGHGNTVKFASLNVKSVRKAAMHTQVEQYMEERNIAILCLQETWVAQTTQYVVGNCLYAMHGHGGTEREYAGVGFARQDMSKYIAGFEPGAGGRLMILGIDMAPATSRSSRYTYRKVGQTSQRENTSLVS